jgi:demethylmenaquinone methyltransferase/2-methoxy-6-polyprenyl-1,4-benzoquinol methylase
MPEPRDVRALFAHIAPRYDFLNRLLSAGVDRRWRQAVVAAASPLAGRRALDICTGTGDLALALAGAGAHVLGLDFTPEMIARAEAKRGASATVFALGDALRLPVTSGAVDLVTVAFGIRNVGDRSACLREMARVVRPGGRVIVLEFSMPRRTLLGGAYRLYFMHVLPRIGGWISGDARAYAYLPRTVLAWPSARQLQQEMEACGLVNCGFQALTGGVAVLSWGEVSAEGQRAPG